MNAATFAFAGLFGIIGAIAQEHSFDCAMELDSNVYRQVGQAQGKLMKAQACLEGDIDAAVTFSVMRGIVDTLGMDCEVVSSAPTRVVIQAGQCPIFMGARNATWEHEMVATSCNAGAMGFLKAAAKQFNPKLTWRMAEFREGVDGVCLEELVLKP